MNEGYAGIIMGTMLAMASSGCVSHSHHEGAAMHESERDHHSGQSIGSADHAALHHYHAQPADPPWLVKAAEFHGHIGPWVAVGAMIGKDALSRLGSQGQWEVEVVCWMPLDKQRPPFSCILDGLQSSSGATMGKQNLRMDHDASVVTGDRPVVFVFERGEDGGEDGRAARGYRYDVADGLAEILTRSRPAIIEPISREIAAHTADELFTIRALSEAELALLKPNRAASSGEAKTR